MSIDVRLSNDAKVRKDLNLFFASDAPFIIKVLKDLENRRDTFFYRHVGPKGPKEMMREKTVRAAAWRSSVAGACTPRYGSPNIPSLHRSARACPSHALAAKKTGLQVR